eukprot:544782-Rhodomonas_salina.1
MWDFNGMNSALKSFRVCPYAPKSNTRNRMYAPATRCPVLTERRVPHVRPEPRSYVLRLRTRPWYKALRYLPTRCPVLALHGTEIPHRVMQRCAICLRKRYAMPGTDAAYGATR